MAEARVFIDTSALLALSHARDQHHHEAVRVARRHQEVGGAFLGTTLILGEFYSHLLYLRGASVARAALRHLLDDPIHRWVEVDAGLVDASWSQWLARLEDQAISLVDAVSFEVMRRAHVRRAFAFDHHFEVAGYELLR